MKKMKSIIFTLIIGQLFLAVNLVWAQDESPKPERNAFESSILLENQTDVVYQKKTLQFNIQHRFGAVNNGSSDLWGLFAASNIRLGLDYTLSDRLGIGFGLSKINVTNPYIDLNVKYKILRQMSSGWPWVNLTYFGNMAIDTQNGDNFDKGSHRMSYFHEGIMSRRISYKFSVQASLQYSHFNAVDTLYENDMFGISIGARYKVSAQTSIILEWTEPTLEHDHKYATGSWKKDTGPYRNVSVGVEINTGAHSFQIFATTYRSILPQYNLHYNTNEWFPEVDGETKLGFMLGFNMTRLWYY
jgi:hypothetical protein